MGDAEGAAVAFIGACMGAAVKKDGVGAATGAEVNGTGAAVTGAEVGAKVCAATGAEVTGAEVDGPFSGSRHSVKPAYCWMLSDVHVIVSPALRVMVLGGGVVPPYFTP